MKRTSKCLLTTFSWPFWGIFCRTWEDFSSFMFHRIWLWKVTWKFFYLSMDLRTACQNGCPTRPKPKKPQWSWIFFWSTGTPRGQFECDIKIFHRRTYQALFKKTDFGTFSAAAPLYLGIHSLTKFKCRVALIRAYYLIKFQPKQSTGAWDRSRGVSLTEHVFLPFLAHFCLYLPHNLM